MRTTPSNYLENWKAGTDIGIMIEDIKKEGLTPDQINKLFTDIRAILTPLGLELKMWGLEADFYRSVDKNYPKTKWKEGAAAMLQKLITEKPESCTFLKVLIETESDIIKAPGFNP